MTNPTRTTETTPLCCGQGGSWAPQGKPLAAGCALCPNSATYWRPDGYVPVAPLGERDRPAT